jgi:hypothetical protein
VKPSTLFIDGLAFWAPHLPDWPAARAAFRNEGLVTQPQLARPLPQLLAPNERRRAPATVAVALEVAACAVAQSGHAAADLLSVFTSSQGDMAINDAMCTALARTPTWVSPTQFHHSVHNAASGYWTLATGCRHASTALSAFEFSFANGLLEAMVQCAAHSRAVLLVGYDMPPSGALKSVSTSPALLGVALVLAPYRSVRTQTALQWQLLHPPATSPPLRSAAAQTLASHALADCLPLFEALAWGLPASLCLPLSVHCGLELGLAAMQVAPTL